MQVKDLIITGDARILGDLYTKDGLVSGGSAGSGGDGSSGLTYTLSKSGSTITLTGSDGSTSSVTDIDTDTNTDTSVISSEYHYKPVKSTTMLFGKTGLSSAKFGDTTFINGLEMDDAGHVTGFVGDILPATVSASMITAGTFFGQVMADSSWQTPGTSLLRNSKLVTSDTNPTVNGEICWTYK